MYYNFEFICKGGALKYLYPLAILVHLYKMVKNIILKWNKESIKLTNDFLIINSINEEIPWHNIAELKFEHGHVDAFLYTELVPETIEKKENKFLNYIQTFKVWFNTGPIKVNLSEIEGDSNEIYNTIVEFKENISLTKI